MPAQDSAPDAPTLSALIVARNEEARLAQCLATVRFCDEIVVVLEGQSSVIHVEDEVVLAALYEQWDDGATTRDAVDYVAEALGVPRRDVYQLALDARKGRPH